MASAKASSLRSAASVEARWLTWRLRKTPRFRPARRPGHRTPAALAPGKARRPSWPARPPALHRGSRGPGSSPESRPSATTSADIVGLKTNRLVEMGQGALRTAPDRREPGPTGSGPGHCAGSSSKARFKWGIASSTLPCSAKADPSISDRFDRAGLLIQNFAALGGRSAGVAGGQQSIGQADTCRPIGGGQPNALAPLGDGSIVPAGGGQRHAPSEYGPVRRMGRDARFARNA